MLAAVARVRVATSLPDITFLWQYYAGRPGDAPGTVGSVPRFEGQTLPNRGRSMFSRSDLDELVAMDARPAVSIYLPTHIAGREIRQDPIRLKNLLSSAAETARRHMAQAGDRGFPWTSQVTSRR
jgi:hypothetical protein